MFYVSRIPCREMKRGFCLGDKSVCVCHTPSSYLFAAPPLTTPSHVFIGSDDPNLKIYFFSGLFIYLNKYQTPFGRRSPQNNADLLAVCVHIADARCYIFLHLLIMEFTFLPSPCAGLKNRRCKIYKIN